MVLSISTNIVIFSICEYIVSSLSDHIMKNGSKVVAPDMASSKHNTHNTSVVFEENVV